MMSVILNFFWLGKNLIAYDMKDIISVYDVMVNQKNLQ